MIRLTGLWLVVCGILVYSWKDWYRGLCGLIMLMAVMEHPDMPKTLFGIQGLNPFNLLLFNIGLAWMAQRGREGLKWDLPRGITVLLLLYLGIVVVGFGRMMRDPAVPMWYYDASALGLFSDYLVNTIKWVIPGLLLFDGCRTEERFKLALGSTLAVYVLLGLQVIKWMPPQYALDPDALAHRSMRVLEHGVGYHRVNLSAMLAGASWSVLAARVLVQPSHRIWIILVAFSLVYAQAMTAGRTGYATWALVGLALSVLKWRKLLLGIPIVVMLVVWLAPGVAGRMTEGFTEESHDVNTKIAESTGARPGGAVDAYTVTAGRSFIWPFVIEKIKEHPWIGYGRQAMLTTGLAIFIYDEYREAFPHPHNAYLEFLFDNGIIGVAPVLLLYVVLLLQSIGLLLDKRSIVFGAIGGVSTALILALMFAATGSQSFYPVEGWMCMWCAIGLMLRVRVQRRKALAGQAPATVESPAPAARPQFAPMVPVGAARTAAGPMIKPRVPAAASRVARPHSADQRHPAPVTAGEGLLLWETS